MLFPLTTGFALFTGLPPEKHENSLEPPKNDVEISPEKPIQTQLWKVLFADLVDSFLELVLFA